MTEEVKFQFSPKNGESIAAIRARLKKEGKDAAIIDANNDGKYNDGDNIKIFDWNDNKAQGYYIPKKGEQGYYGGTPAGQVDKTESKLGMSLHKTFAGKTIDEIKKIYPNAILVDPKGGNEFKKGTTLMLTAADGTRHNIYFRDGNASVREIWKMLSGQSKESIEFKTSERLGDTLDWYNVPAPQEKK